ncbi:MAG: VOC family protein [Planctomycetes bacterium]|nr:VOC family protein [Planctomycetota bacterium]
MPPLFAIHETCLYADDLAAMERFYSAVLGLRKVSEMATRGLTLRVDAKSVLLIFNPNETRQPHAQVPAHGAIGAGHCAFSIPPDSLDEWRAHLSGHNVPIERDVSWESGAISLYFRDPAGNSVELIAGELWPA